MDFAPTRISVADPEPPGAARYEAAPDLEPIFLLAGAESREPEPLFMAAPAPAGSMTNKIVLTYRYVALYEIS